MSIQAKEFDGQNGDEEVILVFRHHMLKMRKGFYLLIIPFLIASIPILIWPENINNLWVAVSGFCIGLMFFFYHWMGWYFSIFILTDRRLRQITQKGFFNRSVIDLGLSKIQNVSYNIPGFSGTIFKYGTLVVQTYVGDLFIDTVDNPQKIYNILSDAIRKSTTEGQMDLHEKDTP